MRFSTVAWTILAGFTSLAAAELAARLDDLIQRDIPVLDNPSAEDLKIGVGDLQRGRPHARFMQFTLNSSGFRGPEITTVPPAGCVRIMALGASETFGTYNSPDHDWPSQLGARLRGSNCTEVVNTAVVGMSLRAMDIYWGTFLVQFQPQLVVLYPPTQFYLDPRAQSAGQQSTVVPTHPFRLRIRDRLKTIIHKPRWLQRYIDKQEIGHILAQHPGRATLVSPSAQGLALLRNELTQLIGDIRAAHVRVILVTHARRVTAPIQPDDQADLTSLRTFTPFVEETVIPEFESEANAIVRQIAAQYSLPLVDADSALSGCRACFADMVHLNDAGAGRLAALIARELSATRLVGGEHVIQ